MNFKRIALTMVCVLAHGVGTGVADSTPTTVAGSVFLDKNGNGRLDRGEKGIAGVRITDGVGFVTSGRDGAYEINLALDPEIPRLSARVISICWSSGKWPTGRWWQRLSDIKSGQHVDFGLRQDKQGAPFVFVFGADNHDTGESQAFARFRDDLKRIRGMVKFGAIAGDIGGYFDRGSNYAAVATSYGAFVKNVDKLPVPMFFTQGNHDLACTLAKGADKTDPLYALGAYTRYLGPTRWSFDYAGVHFVGLDWTRLTDGQYNEGLSETGVKWLAKDLASVKRGTRILMFMHFFSGHEGLAPLAAKHRVEYVFCGHTHRNKRLVVSGVPALTTMSMCGAYKLITVREKGLDIVDRCTGCGPNPKTPHRRWCALFLQTWAMKRRRGQRNSLTDVKLSNASRTVENVKVRKLGVLAVIEPGSAKKYGLRIGTSARDRNAVLIAFTGKTLTVGRGKTPLILRPDERVVNLEAFAANGVVKAYVNGRVLFEVPFEPDGPVGVTLFAEGGAAVFKKVEAFEIK